jgi:hypothetical protein
VLSLGRRTGTTDDKVEVLRSYVEQLPQIALLNGQPATGVVLSGTASIDIRHSLGRSYQGALITGASAIEVFLVLTPEAASAGGLDVTKFVAVRSPVNVASDTIVNVWVY